MWELFGYYIDYLEYNIQHTKDFFCQEHLPRYTVRKRPLYLVSNEKNKIVLDITTSSMTPNFLPSGDCYNLVYLLQCLMPTQELFATHFREVIVNIIIVKIY